MKIKKEKTEVILTQQDPQKPRVLDIYLESDMVESFNSAKSWAEKVAISFKIVDKETGVVIKTDKRRKK